MESAFERFRARLSELRAELAESRAEFRYRVERGRVAFEAEARARHRAARDRLSSFLARTRPLVVPTAPVSYAMILPLGFLDLAATLLQHVRFPVCGIPGVRRGAYVFVDRRQLGHLNRVCCGYANGTVAHAREVAARTEQYWCPIEHSRAPAGPRDRHPGFIAFGDAEGFRRHLEAQRSGLADEGR